MRYILLIIILGCGTIGTQSAFKVSRTNISLLHYNIKELSSSKLASRSNSQISSVAKIVKQIKEEKGPIDIFSLNEIQFDIKHVPNRNFTSQGQNLKKLAKRLEVNFKHSIFSQANTGNLAIKNRKNEYVTSFSVKDARRIADPVNFGIFPANIQQELFQI